MIKAVIFDMDGVLIDSEPLWKQAERKVFATVDIDLNEDLCKQTTGFDGITTIRHWYNYKPWKNKSFDAIKLEIEAEVKTLISNYGIPREGLVELLERVKKENLPLAVASSSPLQLIEFIIHKLGIADYFQLLISSESEQAGKPHPAVYLTAAKKLNVQPCHCLAFEDSIVGLTAAKCAGMLTVALPDPYLCHDERYDMANLVLSSLREFEKHASVFFT